MPGVRLFAAVVGAAIGAIGLAPGVAQAAPSPDQHPYTFTVTCEQLGTVSVAEGGASPIGFVQGDLSPRFVVVSAAGAVYQGALAEPPPDQDPVFTFARDWGARAGLQRDVCTRTNTEVRDGMSFTAFETFVVALLPRP
jgi:hypothetical protein